MWHKSQDTSTEAATGLVEQTRKLSSFQLGFQQMFIDFEPNAWMTLVFNRTPSTGVHLGNSANTQVQQRNAGTSVPNIRQFPEFQSGLGRSYSSTGRSLAPMSIDGAHAILNEFHQRLDARVFGRKWCRGSDCRSLYIGVVEHPDTNLHLHVAFRFPADRLEVALFKADPLWRKLVASGNVVATVPYDLAGLASYNAKRLTAARSDLILLPNVGSMANL